MNFKNGYLGACIIVLGVVMTIVGGYLLSIEVTDEEVTKYSYVADLNGLFDSEPAPAYIEYNPSTNYTGYYTDASVIGINKYFDGVDYDVSGQPNAYRLNLQPLDYSDGTTSTLTGTDWTSGARVSLMAMQRYTNTGNVAGAVWGTGTTGTDMTLSDLITSLNVPQGNNLINLSSHEGLSALEEPVIQADINGILELDWVLFSARNMWYDKDTLRVQSNEYMTAYPEDPQYKPTSPMLSCSVDLTRNTATLYYDYNYQNSAGTYQIDEVIVSFGGSGTGLNSLHLGTTLDYWYATKQNPTYMDIRGGVNVEESS